jgi:hypothetical protein
MCTEVKGQLFSDFPGGTTLIVLNYADRVFPQLSLVFCVPEMYNLNVFVRHAF